MFRSTKNESDALSYFLENTNELRRLRTLSLTVRDEKLRESMTNALLGIEQAKTFADLLTAIEPLAFDEHIPSIGKYSTSLLLSLGAFQSDPDYAFKFHATMLKDNAIKIMAKNGYKGKPANSSTWLLGSHTR